MKDWQEIGLKGIKEELKWKKYYNKKKSIIERTFSNKFKRVFEIQKQNRIKEAKKKKISINSLDQLEQLKKMDKYANF